MIKKLLSFFFCLSINLCFAQHEWRHLYNSPTTAIIYTVNCINDSTCYFGTSTGLVFKTIDGGQSFTTLNVGAVGKIHSVNFPSPLIGYVLASNGIFKTMDGGIIWNQVYAYNFNNVYGDMKFYNDSIGLAACNQYNNYFGGSVSTINGGLSWGGAIGGMQLFFDVEFVTSDIVFATGYGFRRLKNGSWTFLNVSSHNIYDISVADSSTIYAVATLGNLTYKSTDLGDTWSVIDSSTSRTSWGCDFLNPQVGYVCGAFGTKCMISKTNDGGNTWADTVFNSFNGFIYRITFPSDSVGYAVGPGGNIFKYSSACQTSSTINLTECVSYTSPSGTFSWTTSGTYTDYIPNSNGCDSTVTINLTIIPVDTSIIQNGSVITANATNASYQWVDCNNGYAAISGETNPVFTATLNGSYAVVVSQNGCSDTSANIIVSNITCPITINPVVCLIYTSPSSNYTWTSSGIYLDTIPNPIGCDSIFTINLTVIPVDTSVLQNGNVLAANATNASYQWLDCNNSLASLNGETNQIFIAPSNGIYALAISQNGCTDTSNCITVSNLICAAHFTVFPDTATPHNWFALNQTSGIAPFTYLWNWGDGSTSTGVSPSHTYNYAGHHNICLTITDSTGCINSYCDSSTYIYRGNSSTTIITINVVPTSILEQDSNENKIIIYPNPSTNQCTITATNFSNATLFIYDITGRAMLQQPFNTKATIDVSKLSKGVYIAEIKDKQGKSIKGKVVKE